MQGIDRRKVLYGLLAGGAAVLAGSSAVLIPSQADAAGLYSPRPEDREEAALAAVRGAVSSELVTRSADGTGIALTFDDGPGPETDDVLDILRDTGVKAVFCVVGKRVSQFPRLVRRIVHEGHALGNHSWDHDPALWKTGATPSAYRRDIARTNTAIRLAAPEAEIPFFRAPFGAWGPDRLSAQVAADMGMTPLSWSLSTTDWLESSSEEFIYGRITSADPGEVILMHDADDLGVSHRMRTVRAVDQAIPDMRRAGRTFNRPKVHPPTEALAPMEASERIRSRRGGEARRRHAPKVRTTVDLRP